MDGSSLHVEGEEAKIQLQMEQKKKEELQTAIELARKEAAENDDGGGSGAKADLQSFTGKNQFNYSERAAQTFNNPMKNRSVETVPPPVIQFKSCVTQVQALLLMSYHSL